MKPRDSPLSCTNPPHCNMAGKVVDIKRETTGGFARGELEISGLGPYSGRHVYIDFQNENLVARDAAGIVLGSVPDLICILETEGTASTLTFVQSSLSWCRFG